MDHALPEGIQKASMQNSNVMQVTQDIELAIAEMAQKRNRSVVVWVLLSLLATPLLMIIILLAIGKNEDYIENHYDRE